MSNSYLFIHPEIRKHLRGAPWEHRTANEITEILLRIPGAYQTRETLNGRSVLGVAIPMSYVRRFMKDKSESA